MTVQIFQQYQFNDDIKLGNTALQWELNNIQQVINNANAGLTTWDNVKVKTFTPTAAISSATITTLTATNDITVTNAGSGLVLKTPDGTKTYRLFIDNNGVFNTLELT